MLLLPNHHDRLALYKANQSVTLVFEAVSAQNILHV